MKFVLKIAKYLVIGIYAMCGVLLLLFAIPGTGWKALTVLTGSMRPAIQPGALVFVHRVPNHDLQVGDVITYINPRNPKQTITHRIVQVTKDQGLPAFVTKGDANPTADPQILGGNVVGRVQGHLPFVGRVVNWARTPLGILLLLGLPGLLIIWDEIKILRRALKKAENQAGGPTSGHQVLESPAPEILATPPVIAVKKPTPSPRRRGMDGIMRLAAIVILGSLFVRGTQASLVSNSVTLTGNRLSTVSAANHIILNRVYLGGAVAPVCPTAGTNISITNTGPASVNQVNLSLNCNVSITNSNNVEVNNSNSQNAQSGSSNVSGNTSGGSATSGNSSNSNTTNTSVNITNGGLGGGLTLPWVELYNPTAVAQNITGWRLKDNSGVPKLLAASVPAHGYLVIAGPFGNGLNPAGDEMMLYNLSITVIDGVSWGTDTQAFNPAVPAAMVGDTLLRVVLGLDTNTASDWTIIH